MENVRSDGSTVERTKFYGSLTHLTSFHAQLMKIKIFCCFCFRNPSARIFPSFLSPFLRSPSARTSEKADIFQIHSLNKFSMSWPEGTLCRMREEYDVKYEERMSSES